MIDSTHPFQSDPWGSAFGNSDSTFVNSRSTATFGFDSTPTQPEKKVSTDFKMDYFVL